MAKYYGIHHLAMATGNMDATVLFWRDLLGMRLVAGLGKPGYRHYFFEISPGHHIAFFEWRGVEPVPERDHGQPVAGPFIFDHVSFGVDREDDLWDLRDKFEAADFWVSEVIDHGFIHSIYAFDPNGIPVEFTCRVGDVDLTHSPRMVDSSPSAVTLEGPDPKPGNWPAVERPTPVEEWEAFPGEGKELINGQKRDWWRNPPG
jgi:catechol 2,3-dioxygenase-like lactoylglutathione lyase family enzyme